MKWAALLLFASVTSSDVEFRNVAAVAGLTASFPNGGRKTKRFILETTGSYWSLFAAAASAYLVALAIIHYLSPQLRPAMLD